MIERQFSSYWEYERAHQSEMIRVQLTWAFVGVMGFLCGHLLGLVSGGEAVMQEAKDRGYAETTISPRGREIITWKEQK